MFTKKFAVLFDESQFDKKYEYGEVLKIAHAKTSRWV